MSGFTRIFDALAREAAEGDDFLESWMGDGDPPEETPEETPDAPSANDDDDPDTPKDE